jgi:hypothetical protein
MANLTYYTSFQDLKAAKVQKSQTESDSTKESELKELIALISDHRHASDLPSRPSSKQPGNGR